MADRPLVLLRVTCLSKSISIAVTECFEAEAGSHFSRGKSEIRAMPPKGSKKSSSAAALPAEPIIRRRRVKGPQAADEDPESTRLAEMHELKDLMQLKNGTFVNAEVLDAFSEGL